MQRIQRAADQATSLGVLRQRARGTEVRLELDVGCGGLEGGDFTHLQECALRAPRPPNRLTVSDLWADGGSVPGQRTRATAKDVQGGSLSSKYLGPEKETRRTRLRMGGVIMQMATQYQRTVSLYSLFIHLDVPCTAERCPRRTNHRPQSDRCLSKPSHPRSLVRSGSCPAAPHPQECSAAADGICRRLHPPSNASHIASRRDGVALLSELRAFCRRGVSRSEPGAANRAAAACVLPMIVGATISPGAGA